MRPANDPDRDLGHLLDVLTSAVTTLDAGGVDGFGEIYLYVAGRRDGAPHAELALEGERMWLATPGSPGPMPRFVEPDPHDASRRALLIAAMCLVVASWRLDLDDLADYLGCGRVLLHRLIAQARDEHAEPCRMPDAVAARLRRLAAVDAERLNAGIGDDVVARWVRDPRTAFSGRSALDLMLEDGETGFRRVQLWMLNGGARAGHARLH